MTTQKFNVKKHEKDIEIAKKIISSYKLETESINILKQSVNNVLEELKKVDKDGYVMLSDANYEFAKYLIDVADAEKEKNKIIINHIKNNNEQNKLKKLEEIYEASYKKVVRVDSETILRVFHSGEWFNYGDSDDVKDNQLDIIFSEYYEDGGLTDRLTKEQQYCLGNLWAKKREENKSVWKIFVETVEEMEEQFNDLKSLRK